MASRHLSVSQRHLLERLVAGEVVTRRSTPELALSVYALRGRGLVLTEKSKAGDWTATLTADGVTAAATGMAPTGNPAPHTRAREPQTERPERTEAIVVPAPILVSAAILQRSAAPYRPRVHAAGSSAQAREAATTTPRGGADSARMATERTRASLKGAADKKGLLRSFGDGSVPVTIGRTSIRRAMAILGAVFTGRTRSRRGNRTGTSPRPERPSAYPA